MKRNINPIPNHFLVKPTCTARYTTKLYSVQNPKRTKQLQFFTSLQSLSAFSTPEPAKKPRLSNTSCITLLFLLCTYYY